MAALLLFALFFFPLTYLYGQAVLHLLRAWFHLDSAERPGFVLTALVGLAVLAFLATLLSLFMPLSALALAIVTLGGGLILVWQMIAGHLKVNLTALRVQTPRLAWLLLALVIVSILEQATHQPSNPDSGIYHAQTIRWAETFPAVPGLGNLHGRLAFNSSWLALQALFSFAFLGLRSFHMLPAVLSALVLFDCWRGLVGWLRGRPTPVNILKTLLIPVFFYVLPSEISSPGTDLPVVLLVWFLASAWMDRPRRDGLEPGIEEIALYILVLFAVTIKLSAAPLLILAAFVGINALRRPVLVGKLAALTIVLLAPWFARSVVQSGYLVYPVPVIDVFQLDWKVPASTAQDERDAIVAYGRLPRIERDEVMAMPVNVWLPRWFENQTLNRKLLLGLAVLSPFLLVGVVTSETLWRERFRIWNIRLFQVYLAALMGGFYWLFSAPDFRFGYGFLVLLILIPILLPLTWVSRELENHTHLQPLILAGALILFQVVFLFRSFESDSIQQRLFIPQDYPVLPTEPCLLKDTSVLCASQISYNECWYESFPCIPFPRPDVELRGESLREGFKIQN
jgi:hypothetical protein